MHNSPVVEFDQENELVKIEAPGCIITIRVNRFDECAREQTIVEIEPVSNKEDAWTLNGFQVTRVIRVTDTPLACEHCGLEDTSVSRAEFADNPHRFMEDDKGTLHWADCPSLQKKKGPTINDRRKAPCPTTGKEVEQVYVGPQGRGNKDGWLCLHDDEKEVSQ